MISSNFVQDKYSRNNKMIKFKIKNNYNIQQMKMIQEIYLTIKQKTKIKIIKRQKKKLNQTKILIR